MKQASNLSALLGIQHGFYNAYDTKDVINPILMNQVHSTDVLVVEKPFVIPPQVDALVTTKKGLHLTVKTADCAPVLLADAQHNVIGAVHAGWKGAFQGIIETTILKMLCKEFEEKKTKEIKQIEEWCYLETKEIIFDSNYCDWSMYSSMFNESIEDKEQLLFIIETETNETETNNVYQIKKSMH